VPLVVSGLGEDALRANAERLAARLEDASRGSLLDVAFSQATTRTAFAERAVVRAGDAATAIRALRQIARGAPPAEVVRASARASRLVFVFPGLGSQHAGMCGSLLDDPMFAGALADCDRALREFTELSVVELLRAPAAAQDAAFARADQVQPLLFAVAVALARRWQALGVAPSAVVGHSQGEVPAAVIAGALSLEDGARIVCLRSRLIHHLPTTGGMASIGLPLVEVERRLAAAAPRLAVAVVNGAAATVVAGERGELERWVAALEVDGVPCRRIKVDRAGHSPEMDAILPEIRAALAGLAPRRASVAFYSTVLGAAAAGSELGAAYWADNLRRPVRLDLALGAIRPDDATVFLELSAHPVLTAPLVASGCEAVVPSLRKDSDAASELRIAAAALHAHGIAVDLRAAFDGTGAQAVELPTYAFQRRHYWMSAPGDDRQARGARAVIADGAGGSEAAAVAAAGSAGAGAGAGADALARLAALPEPERRAALLALIGDETAAVLRLAATDGDALERSFVELGLDSIMAIDLRRQLQRRTGVKLPPGIFFEHATVERLAAWLSAQVSASPANVSASEGSASPGSAAAGTSGQGSPGQGSSGQGSSGEGSSGRSSSGQGSSGQAPTATRSPRATRWVGPYTPNPAAKLRLFCYPHSGGSASTFRAWPAALPRSVELCPIQPPGRWSRYQEPPPRTVGEAARGLVEGLDGMLDLPFALVGHSLGASVAFEAARLLERAGGARPVGLIVAGRNAPQRSTFLAAHRQAIETARDEDLVALIGRLYGADRIRGTDDPALEAVVMDGLRADLRATARYEFEPGAPLGCALWAFGGLDDALIPAPDVEAWGAHTTGGFAWAMLPGDHYFVHDPRSGFLTRLGEALDQLAAAAERPAAAAVTPG
ncbi:MAG TPA: acyltransferase domain-containing protein, partial [Kofleriaceae bacterium]|nr:acyltransferase domain-containing protein [Kofleriaceae bacterium]